MDLDGDGYNDILSGSYSRMSQPMAGLFQVLWGQPDGSFKPASVLNGTDDKPLIIPADSDSITENICTRPMAVDWDADGDLDLVVGNFAGSFYVFTGKGDGSFLPEPKLLTTDSGPLRIKGVHSDPFPVDWDNDGDIDLLSGSSQGGVQWAENVAGTGDTPTFSLFRDLIEPTGKIRNGNSLSQDDLVGPTGSTRVWVDDVNSDGKLDLLVGDSMTLVGPAKGLTEEESAEKQVLWQKRIAEASKELRDVRASGGDQDEVREANAKFRELYAKRSEFIIKDRTGFVWLYLQK